jgi:hypothetical protein
MCTLHEDLCTLHEDLCTLIIKSRSFLFRMRSVSDQFAEKIKTHFVFSDFFFENFPHSEIMWKNIVEPGRPQTTIWRMCIACRISKDTHTHTLRICNYHCSSTTLMLARTCLSVTFVRTVLFFLKLQCFDGFDMCF